MGEQQNYYHENEEYADFLEGWDASFYAKYADTLCPDEPGGKALDVGCGAGLLCEPLARLGADVTGGFMAFEYMRASKSRMSLIFKDFHANFLKRAEGDVHFLCEEGQAIQELVKQANKTGERENMPVHIIATVPSISKDPVAKFILTLSIKKK